MGDMGFSAELLLGVGEKAGGPAAMEPASDIATVAGELADASGTDMTLMGT